MISNRPYNCGIALVGGIATNAYHEALPLTEEKITCLHPSHWPYRADIPQRYMGNGIAYLARGGKVRLEEDVAGFVADGDHGDIARFFFLCMVQDQIQKEGLSGDLAELGVYKGATASVLARIARNRSANLWLFDTFEGFSTQDLTGIDADKPQGFQDTSVEAVRARVGSEGVTIVQGRFPDSTDRIPSDLSFCVVHIDCDLYEPILAALAYFYPRMVPGGYIIVHDYSSLAWNGAERAVDEFFADKSESVIPLPDGAGSCVVRRARDPGHDAHWTRRPLPTGEWVGVTDSRLQTALKEGWSGFEDWGVWGVGGTHTLLLPAGEIIRLEVDCAVALIGQIERRTVTLSVDDRNLDIWTFSRDRNRGVHEITILQPDGGTFGPTDNKALHPGVLVTFCLSEPGLRPCDHDDTSKDDRELGLALHRVRLHIG